MDLKSFLLSDLSNVISFGAIKCFFSPSHHSDLRLFKSFVYNILSINEGVASGL